MKNLSFLLIFSLLGILGCNKSDDTPPAPPITAENTFSCKINEELFVPENHGGFIDQDGYIISILEDNSWIITLSNKEKTLYLFVKKVDRIGEYNVFKSDGDQFFVQDSNTGVELRDRVKDLEYVSHQESEKIEVLSYVDNQKLILQFNKIVLHSTKESNNVLILTDGKLNLNKETLNKD